MRAERDKRAAILTAEGSKQSAILTAEGETDRRDPAGRGPGAGRRSCAPRARPRPSRRCSTRSTRGTPTDQVLAYQYLQSLPLLAQGTANKVLVIPAELSGALGAVSRAFAPGAAGAPPAPSGPVQPDQPTHGRHGRHRRRRPCRGPARGRAAHSAPHRLTAVLDPGTVSRPPRPAGPGFHRAHGCRRTVSARAGRGPVHRRGREGDPARPAGGLPTAVGAHRAQVATGPHQGPGGDRCRDPAGLARGAAGR